MSPVVTLAYEAAPMAAGSQELRHQELAGFLKLLELDASACAQHPDALDRIERSDLQVVIVHNVFPASVMASIVAKLRSNESRLLQTWFPPKFRSWFLGRNINLAGPDLDHYFQEAHEFMPALEQLFAIAGGFQSTIGAIVSALDQGLPFGAPAGPKAGQSYMLATLRAHMEQGYISAHFDNEQALRPTFGHLRQLVRPHMLSFVLTMDPGGTGGALQIYKLRCEPHEARLLSDDSVAQRPDVSQLDSVCLRVPAGSMVLLDSGRYLHRVSPVSGGHWRWTACGFMALSHDGSRRYCWG